MTKMCYCGLESTKRICKYVLIMPLLAYIFVKRNVRKNGHGCCAISSAISTIAWAADNIAPANMLFYPLYYDILTLTSLNNTKLGAVVKYDWASVSVTQMSNNASDCGDQTP